MPSPMLRRCNLAVPVLLTLITVACGDTYRPVAQPIIGPPPSPDALHFVASISTNGPADRGSASRIDVSGDTLEGIFATGVAPTHAALTPNGNKLYVANSAEDTVSSNNTSTPTVATLISLPPNSQPSFVHTTESGNIYVANSGNSTVSVINSVSDVVVATVLVGTNPTSMAEMPNARKLYVSNQGSGTVTVINPIDDSLGVTIPVGSSPVWTVARSDNARIYVLDSGGTVFDIDTLSDAVIGTVSTGGIGSNFLLYDQTSNALLVTNSASGTVSVLDASTDPPTLRPGSPIAITAASSSPCASAEVPQSVAILPDGRAYVASFQLDSGLICAQASIINSSTGSIKATIPLSSQPVDAVNPTGCASARFRVFAAASGGGTTSNFKVYVSQCDAGQISVIDTFAVQGASAHPADVLSASVDAPPSSFPPVQVAISAAAQDSSTNTTTYSFTPANAGLQAGMKVFITGMANDADNGVFAISATDAAAGTFDVTNPFGVTASGQSGAATVTPPQNPIFLVAGP